MSSRTRVRRDRRADRGSAADRDPGRHAAGATPRPAARQPARAGRQTVRAGARAGGAHPGARARRGPVLARWCALAGVVGSRRRRRHPQGVDDRARVAGTGSPRRRGGVPDGRRAAATATGWTCARPIPSVLGEQGQIPAHTTLSVDELVAYDQRVHEQLERLAEQRAQLAGDDPSCRPGARSSACSSSRSRRSS